MTAATDPLHRVSPRLVFANPSFARYWSARLMASFAIQIISVSVGWQIYDLTRDPLQLGFVGLVQFLPSLLLVLVTGTTADRYSRRGIMAVCIGLEAACGLALLAFALAGLPVVWPIFAVLAVIGVARAFLGPAVQALLPNLVPQNHLATAIAWNSSSWQIATICGPVAGGLLYGISAQVAYATATVMLLAGVVLTLGIPKPPRRDHAEPRNWAAVVAGFHYIFGNRLLLGAVSLDLFAVLLGGAVALMPAYARDILEVGPWGLGMLRAAPGIGAMAVGALLAFRPIRDHAGLWLFVCVAGFGLSTIGFGLSTTPWISILMLMLMGGTDMVSVYVRTTMVQLATPDAVRGRVLAVEMVFIGASNELGEFRAGLMARLIGVVGAVVFGGIGTVAVSALWAGFFPELRRVRKLDSEEAVRQPQ